MGHIEKNKIFSDHRGNISDNIIYSLRQKKTFIINSKNTAVRALLEILYI